MSNCEHCGSPYHKECVGKSVFKTRRQLGLQEGELPFQFRIEVNPEIDDEVEVARKKALLRLNSTRIYNQMGYAVKAHEACVESDMFLKRMMEHCDEEEKAQFRPLFEGLRILQSELMKLRESKIKQSVKMEELLDAAHKQSRKVQKVIKKKTSAKLKKATQFSIVKLPSVFSQLAINYPANADGTDPLAVFDEAKQAILKKEKLGKHEFPTKGEN